MSSFWLYRTSRNNEAQPVGEPGSSSQHCEGDDVDASSIERESSAQSLTAEHREIRFSDGTYMLMSPPSSDAVLEMNTLTLFVLFLIEVATSFEVFLEAQVTFSHQKKLYCKWEADTLAVRMFGSLSVAAHQAIPHKG